MVATIGSIQVAFRSDMAAYEASLKAGEKSTGRFERNANRAALGVGQSFIRMGGLAKAAIGGLVAGVAAAGVTGAVGALRDVARSVAEIGDQAKRAGVSAKVFQEWSAVAQAARIPVDSLTDGLKELSLRADEFIVTGAGPAAEAFARLGYSATDLKTKLADPSALLLEMIGRLGQLDKAAQIRIADELFGGTGGERFVELISQGTDGIRATIDEAHRLGNVLSDEVIESAAELDRKFNLVAQTVGNSLKRAIVEAAEALQNFISAFNGFEAQRTAALDERLAALGKERLDVERQILELRDKQRRGEGVGDGIFGTGIGESTIGEALAVHERRMEALSAEEEKILAVVAARRKAQETPAPPAGETWTPPAFTAGGGGRAKGAASADREAEAVRRLISELEEELRLIGATDLERDISTTLRRAGAAATDEQRAKIVGLVAALHAEAEAQQRAGEAMSLYRDIAGGVLNDLRGALADGKLEWAELADVAINALNKIVDKLLNDLLDAIFTVNKAGIGGGGGGDFLGTLGTLNLTKGL